jgi:peptidoglycan/LPS O-acetylase OafA/YrhL
VPRQSAPAVTPSTDLAASQASAMLSIPRVPALDGLRGVAIAGVLLFHGGELIGGYLGVDLFFTLSGFLITSLLLTEWQGTRRIRLAQFWARRARRLLPALFLMLLGVAAYAAFVAAPTELERIRDDGLATLGYVANWHSIIAGNDYWALFRAPSPLDHTWSLAIEEQFYLVWPVVVLGLVRGRNVRDAARRVTIAALGGGIVLGGWAMVLASRASDARLFVGTDTRAPAVLVGAALAGWWAWRGPGCSRGGRVALELAGIVGILALALAWTRLDGQSPVLFRGGLLACALAEAVLLAAAAHPLRGPIAVCLSFGPLRGLGIISYGVYLWHWPVYVWLDPARTRLDGWSLTIVRIAVTLMVASASYVLVERPIRRGALNRRVVRIVAPGVAVAVVVSLLAATAGAVVVPGAAGAPPVVTGAPPSGPPSRVLVAGDSVAFSLGWYYRPDDIPGVASIDITSELGCGIYTGTLYSKNGERLRPSPGCAAWSQRWRAAVRRDRPVLSVMLIGAWEVFDIKVGDRLLRVGSAAHRAYLRRQLDEAIAILSGAGGRVVVLTTPCFEATSQGIAVGQTTRDDPHRIAALNDMLRSAVARHAASATLIDLQGYLCPNAKYASTLDGVALRVDGVHFTSGGAQLVWRWLGPQLATPTR